MRTARKPPALPWPTAALNPGCASVEVMAVVRSLAFVVRSRLVLQGEILALRHQLAVCHHGPPDSRVDGTAGSGGIRRECLDHVVVLHQRHLRRLLNHGKSRVSEGARTLNPWSHSPLPVTKGADAERCEPKFKGCASVHLGSVALVCTGYADRTRTSQRGLSRSGAVGLSGTGPMPDTCTADRLIASQGGELDKPG